MKAPVPPAQEPFMRCSAVRPRYVTLASSPPSSIITSVCGYNAFIAFVSAITSCTKGIRTLSAIAIPPEPVIATCTFASL